MSQKRQLRRSDPKTSFLKVWLWGRQGQDRKIATDAFDRRIEG